MRIIKIQLIGMQQAAYNKSRLYLCGQLCHKFQYVHFLQFKNDNDKKKQRHYKEAKGFKVLVFEGFLGGCRDECIHAARILLCTILVT